jgi:hypothetical protein
MTPSWAASPVSPAKEVAEPPSAAEEISEIFYPDVLAVESSAGSSSSSTREATRRTESLHLVVLTALLLVGDDSVRLRNAFEPLLRRGIIRVRVWMKLLSELTKGLFDIVLGRGLVDPQVVVIVLFEPFLFHELLLLRGLSPWAHHHCGRSQYASFENIPLTELMENNQIIGFSQSRHSFMYLRIEGLTNTGDLLESLSSESVFELG